LFITPFDLKFVCFLDGHETLVRNEVNNRFDSDEEFDSDLDINDFITKFDSIDIRNDEVDSRQQFQLDPSVWTNPIKPTTPQKVPHKFPAPPPGIHPVIQNRAPQNNPNFMVMGAPPPQSAAPKILSLEEIERNLITQQQQLQQQKVMQEKLAALQAKVSSSSPVPQPSQQPQQQQTPQQQGRKVMQNQQQQSPQQNQNQQGQGIVFPPSGFPPIPPHLQGPNFPNKFNPIMHPMMNNFNPNFPGGIPGPPMRIPPPQMTRLPPHLINMQANPLLYQSQPQNTAQFNQRLVQEIQQNHPMLNHFYNVQQQRQQQQQQMHHNNNNGNNNRHMKYNNHVNGKPEDYDEYANLMSNRDKQFLITIQLMQLNTETPYFDDFYYTMYKERVRMRAPDNESQAHRDNQMNHPFTQPKGHAQMLLRQFNNINKNGFQNQKNGGRERRNSESSQKNNEKEPPTPRTYTPLQFENSLGKLQCGSVTAPRKIIDMEIVAMAEIGNQNSGAEFTLQKKSRQILMHIETLYKIVLKLEDFHNPLAIAATIILKEKREKQRLQMEMEGKREEDESSTKSSISINEPETQNELMIKLLSMMPVDKIPGMMTVRKGRVSSKHSNLKFINTKISLYL
jgi:DNA topoisomerase 2-associated protein PAT1